MTTIKDQKIKPSKSYQSGYHEAMDYVATLLFENYKYLPQGDSRTALFEFHKLLSLKTKHDR